MIDMETVCHNLSYQNKYEVVNTTARFSQRHVSPLYADGDGVGGLALLLGLLLLPQMLLVAIQHLLCRASLKLLFHVPLWTHHVVSRRGHWHSSSTHPTLITWLLRSRGRTKNIQLNIINGVPCTSRCG